MKFIDDLIRRTRIYQELLNRRNLERDAIVAAVNLSLVSHSERVTIDAPGEWEFFYQVSKEYPHWPKHKMRRVR